MNLADYLSELLEQHDEVSVPQLGYFVRERMNAYYNDVEGKFYPPYHQVKFIQQLKDDDTFTKYVADKKNISLASSKYFTEKFITKLKDDATIGEYRFADLGFFKYQADKLIFNSNDNSTGSDPSFYGYPSVNINKAGQQTHPELAEMVLPTQISAPSEQIIEEQVFEEQTSDKKPISIWLLILLITLVITLTLVGAYKLYPSAFDPLSDTYHNITGNKDDIAAAPVYTPKVKAVINNKTAPVTDTTLKTVALAPIAATTSVNAVDTLNKPRFEIIANSYERLKRATADSVLYKAKGVDAKILKAAPGRLIKISVGTFYSRKEAERTRIALVKSQKIGAYSYTLKIKPKK